MRFNPAVAIVSIVALFALGLLLLSVFFGLYGYVLTAACAVSLASLLVSIIFARKDIAKVLSGCVSARPVAMVAVAALLFTAFAAIFIRGNELIFFDENIYQDIAMNILAHGNALTCIYGTGFLRSCYENTLGFDPAGPSFLLAVAFGIFGVGNATAYGLELLLAAASIVLVFLLASVLTQRGDIGALAAVIFALTPELSIWSRTLTNPSVPFMAFALLALLLFVVFTRKSSRATFCAFLSSLAFAMYVRTEAVLLIPIAAVIFFVVGDGSMKKTAMARLKTLAGWLGSGSGWLPIVAAFALLVEPQVYFMFLTAPEVTSNAQFYLGAGAQTFSLSNLVANVVPNVQFFAGMISAYPIVFLPELTLFAIIGVVILLGRRGAPNARGILVSLLCMFMCYYLLYDFYFSGSVLSGTSVRFMLITYPALSVLAAYGILWAGEYVAKRIAPRSGGAKAKRATYAACAVIVLAFFVIPFIGTVNFITNPTLLHSGYPGNYTLNTATSAGPYSLIYPNRSLTFIEDNYALVPSSCLVISLAPYLWYGLNRSASSPPTNYSNASFKNYSCFVFDYDYWCTIKPYNTTLCRAFTADYKTRTLATESGWGASNFSLYQLLNYTGGKP